jgi:hypothetical protein
MNKEEFINSIKSAVVKGSIESVQETLASPPGRSPEKKIIMLSEWFNNLSIEGKEMVKQIIYESVHSAVFGFLCVLDGVRPIEKTFDKGELKLYYKKDRDQTLLNNSEDDYYLHELL